MRTLVARGEEHDDKICAELSAARWSDLRIWRSETRSTTARSAHGGRDFDCVRAESACGGPDLRTLAPRGEEYDDPIHSLFVRL